MTKERRTMSLDREVDDYLASDGVNASQLVNRLVKNHVSSGGDERAMLELRREQLESEVADLTSRLETKQAELSRVNERLGNVQDDREDLLAEVRDTLRDTPRDPANAAIRTQADRLDMTPQELVDELERGDADE